MCQLKALMVITNLKYIAFCLKALAQVFCNEVFP